MVSQLLRLLDPLGCILHTRPLWECGQKNCVRDGLCGRRDGLYVLHGGWGVHRGDGDGGGGVAGWARLEYTGGAKGYTHHPGHRLLLASPCFPLEHREKVQ